MWIVLALIEWVPAALRRVAVTLMDAWLGPWVGEHGPGGFSGRLIALGGQGLSALMRGRGQNNSHWRIESKDFVRLPENLFHPARGTQGEVLSRRMPGRPSLPRVVKFRMGRAVSIDLGSIGTRTAVTH